MGGYIHFPDISTKRYLSKYPFPLIQKLFQYKPYIQERLLEVKENPTASVNVKVQNATTAIRLNF